jgi:putative endonuclease
MSSSGLSRGSITQHTPYLDRGARERNFGVCILASKARGTLYVGVTSGLIFRIEQHRAGKGSTCTRKYRVHMLAWYEEFANVREAIQREKTIKKLHARLEDHPHRAHQPALVDLDPALPGVAPVPTLLPPRNAGSSAQGRG